MSIAPSWQDVAERTRREARQEALGALLTALADHVEAPSHERWTALSARASACDDLAGPLGGDRWASRIGDLAEGLIAGRDRAWTTLASAILDAGPGLMSQGPGARLRALSPFAGKVLVTVRGGAVGGEVSRLVTAALDRAGAATGPSTSYLLALDPDALSIDGGSRVHGS